MKALLAFDKFKGTLTAAEASAAAASCFREAGFETAERPIADGGDGTASILAALPGFHRESVRAHDPFGRPAEAFYALSDDGSTAFIELASASGIALLKPSELNVQKASTFGTGELAADAIRKGASSVTLCLGGSAGNDGGAGILAALGCIFRDADGKNFVPDGGTLHKIQSIDASALGALKKQTRFHAACDVTNPLCGPQGAAAVYAPQKGASPDEVKSLDAGLRHFAAVAEKAVPGALTAAKEAGTGAAGGTSWGLRAFLDADIAPGFELIRRLSGLDAALDGVSVVVTGEGRLDSQTLCGKGPGEIARLARTRQLPVLAVCGSFEDWAERRDFFDAVFALTDLCGRERAFADPAGSLANAARAAAKFAREKL